MVKSIVFAIASCCLLSASRVQPYLPVSNPHETVYKCALPAPKNIHLEVTGTTFFQIAWNAVPEAAYFRVNLYRSSDNKLINTRLVPAFAENNFALMNGLEPGITYNVSIYSVCSNGMESPKGF